jgi:hypothetical protein
MATIDREDAVTAQRVVEALVPDPGERRVICQALADSIAWAHEREPGSWSITLHPRVVRLNVGKLMAFDIRPGEVHLGLAVPSLEPDVATELASANEPGDPFAVSPECRVYTIPSDAFADLFERVRTAHEDFIRVAVTTARRAPYRDSHSPGVLAYLQTAAARALPAPEHGDENNGDSGETSPPSLPLGPAAPFKGASQIFSPTNPRVDGLLNELDVGDLGLPDLQRPFVWKASKVRDLIDSMFQGYPVGYVLFWRSPQSEKTVRAIGTSTKEHEPTRLIVDGQQRLTSLYAVMRGKPVLDDQFRTISIAIAFRPRDCKFEVASAATSKDPEYVSNISELWKSDAYSFAESFCNRLGQTRSLEGSDRSAIHANISRLHGLTSYQLSGLEISADTPEDKVAEVFVRINSQGKSLTQGDFILTLLSVHWDEGRRKLEDFARGAAASSGAASAFNHLVKPSPDQMLRVAIATGFYRARLRSAYQLLRGSDPATGRASPELRDAQLATLKDAVPKTLDLGRWHAFLSSVVSAGFRRAELISSETALLYAYALFLIGRAQCSVEEHALKKLISRWFFATSLTGRYTSGSETQFESDLARLKDASNPASFVDTLEGLLSTLLTQSYWDTTLPAALETSSTASPAFLAYMAAQNRLNAPVLFSDVRIAEALDPLVVGSRKAIEQHHLFPRDWLRRNGITDQKRINQVANLALVEWPDNALIEGEPPTKYAPILRKRFGDAAWQLMRARHALPEDWESQTYDRFLAARRVLMAGVIRAGYEHLSDPGTGELSVGTGTPTEKAVWTLLESAERKMRDHVEQAYAARHGSASESRMREVLGEDAWKGIEKNKGSGAALGKRTVDCMYLAQLTNLMLAPAGWESFKPMFVEKARLQSIASDIAPVRNALAHFNAVAPLELERCSVACKTLLAKIP